jgi:hypothetical protein
MSNTAPGRPAFLAAEHGIIPVRAGTYSVPLAFLDTVAAEAWAPHRLPPIRRAYAEGKAAEFPAIRIVFWPDGSMAIDDGNHRLTVAREEQAERIRVRFLRGAGRTCYRPIRRAA